jgi:hypothetical protein
VVHVGDGKYDAQLIAFFEHATQQGHGVRTAGDGDGNPLAGTKETGSEPGGRRMHRCAHVRANTQLLSRTSGGIPRI